MASKVFRILALVIVIGVVIAIITGKLGASRDKKATPAAASNSERKVLYWYDSMHPEYKSDKPGIAPDCGMELTPKYADEAEPTSAPAHAAEGHTPPSSERKVLYWYDSMHPEYKSDKPGIAPDCGMELTPKYADEVSTVPGTVTIPPDRQRLIGVRTDTVKQERLTRDLRTTGIVTPDETRIAHVHVKVNGFVENVFVNYVGAEVKKGQPLFTIYAPELVASQQEYLIAKRGQQHLGASPFTEVSSGAQSLVASARERLRLWDLTDKQISKLDETGQVQRTITVYSPVSGIVQDRKAFPNISVNPETDIYTITDLSRIWVLADVYEYEAPFVRVGQRATVSLSYYPGKTWNGRVAFIAPGVDPQSRTLKARIEIPNPGLTLKPQMFADVQLAIDYGQQVVVPQEAVLDSGQRQIVFVSHDGGKFEPRQVTTGAKIDGKAAILAGLKPGETIVTSGNFLIDSESRLSGAMSDMKH